MTQQPDDIPKRNMDNKRKNPLITISLDDLIKIMTSIDGKPQVVNGDKVIMPCYSNVCNARQTQQVYLGIVHGRRQDDPYETLYFFACTKCSYDRKGIIIPDQQRVYGILPNTLDNKV